RGHKREPAVECLATCHLHFGAMLLRERAGCRLQFGGAHVVRRRVGEIPAERHAFDDASEIFGVDAFRRDEPHDARFGLAVAGKLISPKRKGESGEPRVVRWVGKMVSTRGQETRQLAGTKPINFRFIRTFNPKQRAGKLSIVARQQQEAARLQLEAGGRDECSLCRAKLLANGAEIVGVDEPDWYRLPRAGTRKYG